MKTILHLFLIFLKIGAITFGSGYVMVLSIEKTLVNKKKILSREEYMNYLTIAQSSPGPLVVNLALFIGHHKFGWRGAMAAYFGTVLPSFVILLMIALFFRDIYTNPTAEAIFKGVRPAVVGIILSPVILFMKDLYKWEYPIVVAVGVLIYLWIPASWAIFSSILFGVAYTYITEKRRAAR